MFIKDYLENKVKAEDFFTENEKLKNESNIAEKMGLSEEDYQKALKGKKLNDILKKYAIKRIKELVKALNEAAKVYYSGQDEIMSNYEYDSLYDELLSLETRFSYELENSPTKSVGYEVESKLKKEKHEYAALSLDKTKDLEELKSWLKDKEGTLGWKLDGLTVQLTYDNKKLTKAVTRGNGEIGEDVTHNAKYFKGIPKEIEFDGHLVVRGEALITYKQFNKINENLPIDEKYKNPRNLASGSVRQLNSKEAARRHVHFIAFELVYAENMNDLKTYDDNYKWLKKEGFDVVEYHLVNKDNLIETVKQMQDQIETNEFPSDGLVLAYNDVAYGKSLGMTGKFPRHSMAFKWKDEIAETKLKAVEWSASRTGLINPIAVFDPVELEQTTVSRASIHNVSIMESLKLGIGDTLSVYKANMIIPQIAENKTKSNTLKVPDVCPVCGSKTEIKISTKDGTTVKMLYCQNPNCQAKNIGKFVHFVERDRMNISGLSEATLEKIIDLGIIKEFRDIYHLSEHKDEFIELEGQGEKSYAKLMKAIEKSRHVKLENLIAALGIPNIGRDAGKKVSKALNGDIDKFNEKLESGNFLDIDDVGEIGNKAIHDWYEKQKKEKQSDKSEYFNLLKELIIEKPTETSDVLKDKVFVITGDLYIYENRKALIEKIESMSGKVTNSISKNTDYLINNDVFSNSSKNKKAKELNINIISEEEFQKMIKK